ncbi:MAG: type II toxin-antitoxin system RelE/ParE family toxin [Methylobacter sp.]|nr:type II toxin-antitoxin system RelE/ParE family toxin [Methylobacter sp.]
MQKTDKPLQKRIASFPLDRLQTTDTHRATGKALQGKLSGLRRYRVGNFRLLCRIEDSELIILVIVKRFTNNSKDTAGLYIIGMIQSDNLPIFSNGFYDRVFF